MVLHTLSNNSHPHTMCCGCVALAHHNHKVTYSYSHYYADCLIQCDIPAECHPNQITHLLHPSWLWHFIIQVCPVQCDDTLPSQVEMFVGHPDRTCIFTILVNNLIEPCCKQQHTLHGGCCYCQLARKNLHVVMIGSD